MDKKELREVRKCKLAEMEQWLKGLHSKVPDSYEVASEWFRVQGHALEEKILQKWPKLNSIKHGNGDDYLKNYVLDNITIEFPQFIAQETKELFEKFM